MNKVQKCGHPILPNLFQFLRWLLCAPIFGCMIFHPGRNRKPENTEAWVVLVTHFGGPPKLSDQIGSLRRSEANEIYESMAPEGSRTNSPVTDSYSCPWSNLHEVVSNKSAVLTFKTPTLRPPSNTSCLITGIMLSQHSRSSHQLSTNTINNQSCIIPFQSQLHPRRNWHAPSPAHEGRALSTSEHQRGSRSTALHAWRKHPRLLEWVQVPPSPLWWRKPALGRSDE